MDHVVYLDTKSKELENLINETKTMIIRGATGRKLPHGRVNIGDVMYFIENNADGMVKAFGTVRSVFNSEKLSEDASAQIVSDNQDKLRLTDAQIKRWAGKRYLVLIETEGVKKLEPFGIDKSNYRNMDDWLPVEGQGDRWVVPDYITGTLNLSPCPFKI